MKYAFWNTHNNEKINDYLEKLLVTYKLDFLGLAEYTANGKQLEETLRNIGLNYTFSPKIGSRLDIFYKGSGTKIIHCADNHYYTVKKIPYAKTWQIIAVVHLPCKMYGDFSGNAEILKDLLGDISRIRGKGQGSKVVIVGDFNMNPFDLPMIEATALQAISSRSIVLKRKSRTFNGKYREFFYNPMWNFVGDEKLPIGSYYYRSPQNAAMYWNTFDQFIVSEELVEEVILDKIRFIDSIGTLQLKNERGEPEVSDHFPLYFEIGE